VNCPKSGLSGSEFVSLVFGVVFVFLILMGTCQYVVGWAYIKQRKIYKKLAKLNRIQGRDQRALDPKNKKEGLNPHVSMEEVFVREEKEDSKLTETEEGKDQENSDPAPFSSETALQNKLEGPTTVIETRSVPTRLGSVQFSPHTTAAPATEDQTSEVSEELEETSEQAEQKPEDKAKRVLKPLREAMWIACGCQMTVVLGVFTCFIIMCYAFMHYKPKVEEDARAPPEDTDLERFNRRSL